MPISRQTAKVEQSELMVPPFLHALQLHKDTPSRKDSPKHKLKTFVGRSKVAILWVLLSLRILFRYKWTNLIGPRFQAGYIFDLDSCRVVLYDFADFFSRFFF